MELPIFDSRDTAYRMPAGAVPNGTAVRFCLRMPERLSCREVILKVIPDGGSPRTISLREEQEHLRCYSCTFTPESPNLYWYHFLLVTDAGVVALSKDRDGKAREGRNCDRSWQLTVYDSAFETPDWLAGGIMYQIFPDRFACSGEEHPGVPSDRERRSDWGGTPHFYEESGGVPNQDYFGGDLKGIEQALDRLAYLGVTCLYLNPIFEAHSNHRYDTADYEKIDQLLGSNEDFESLCRTASQLGIRVILDGVFNHTGADSRYFNKHGRYPQPGACQSLNSPYSSWYHFFDWPRTYACWWNFDSLPEVNEQDPGYLSYMTGPDGILRRWLRAGASGWRLDVADELPESFLCSLRQAVKAENSQALIVGEVWEDASNKVSYGQRRHYLLGHELDSVMNYPFRNAILSILHGGSARHFYNEVEEILENYPPQSIRVLMNIVGTHDTERILTQLAGEPANGRGRKWQVRQSLSPEQKERGLRLVRLAAALQYCLPGVPCLYYGDEAGTEGYQDPFCRGCYPWGGEDKKLLQWYHHLGQIRRLSSCLRDGSFHRLSEDPQAVAFEREDAKSRLICAVNPTGSEKRLPMPEHCDGRTVNLGAGQMQGCELVLPAEGCAILMIDKE